MHPVAFAKHTGDVNVRESARQEIPLFSYLLALRITQCGLTCGRNAERILPLHPLRKMRCTINCCTLVNRTNNILYIYLFFLIQIYHFNHYDKSVLVGMYT